MNLNFLKLDINILNDAKIKIIRKYPDGGDLFVLWIGLLCMAMKSDNSGYIYITQGVPYTIDDIANELNIEKKIVEMGFKLFQQYKMIDIIENGIIEIINFDKHQQLDKIEKAKQISRESSQKYRNKKKRELLSIEYKQSDVTVIESDIDGCDDVTKSDDTDKETDIDTETDTEKEKEIDTDIDIDINIDIDTEKEKEKDHFFIPFEFYKKYNDITIQFCRPTESDNKKSLEYCNVKKYKQKVINQTIDAIKYYFSEDWWFTNDKKKKKVWSFDNFICHVNEIIAWMNTKEMEKNKGHPDYSGFYNNNKESL